MWVEFILKEIRLKLIFGELGLFGWSKYDLGVLHLWLQRDNHKFILLNCKSGPIKCLKFS